jgi:hypothetical protein
VKFISAPRFQFAYQTSHDRFAIDPISYGMKLSDIGKKDYDVVDDDRRESGVRAIV